MHKLSAPLQRLMRRGTDFLGTQYAILGGAMTWVSDRHLVSAISNNGGFGVLASGAMSPAQLTEEIRQTQALTTFPFGVNLITLHPQLDALIDVCVAENVSHIVLAGGVPKTIHIAQAKTNGAKVICFAPALVLAKRLIKNGADALVIEGMEAGGHVGPVSTSVLVQEMLPIMADVPVFVAGGIARGEAIFSYLKMGAAGCQLGTRFVVADESGAHPDFKRAFIKAHARDATLSIQQDARFPVIPVRGIQNKGTRAFAQIQHETIGRFDRGEISMEEGQLIIEHFWSGSLRRAVKEGDIENGSLMAGQSVGLVTETAPLSEIMASLLAQSESALLNHSGS